MMEMPAEDQLHSLNTDSGYRQHFMNLDHWRPYVDYVCQRDNLSATPHVRIGQVGTYPTFIIDDRWILKFFGRNFAGDTSYQAEFEVNQLLTDVGQVPAPTLHQSGLLFPDSTDWPWPYLLIDFVAGTSIGEVYNDVTFEDKLAMAQWIGQVCKTLHHLPLTATSLTFTIRNAYYRLVKEQYEKVVAHHQTSGILPTHLVDQLETYLLPLEQLLAPSSMTRLIHADLTADHIMGQFSNEHWQPQHLIDFGDAMVGDFHYELIALHLDLFKANKTLLQAYLESYGLSDDDRQRLPHRAMSLTLLHRFDVLEGLPELGIHLTEFATLKDLETRLWG
ncbi:MAG: aminoglycoside phosphotransferase family protein [Chloroflexota bacterium]